MDRAVRPVSAHRLAERKVSFRDSARNAIRVGKEHGFQSIAFPLIGVGSGGFKQGKPKQMMLDELQKLAACLPTHPLLHRGYAIHGGLFCARAIT